MKHKLIGILAAATLVTNAGAQSVDTVIATGLSEPFAVVSDAAGFIYVTDAANNRIEKFNVTTGVKSTLAGLAGQPPGSANGTGSFARFWYPQGMISARGGLVVADSANNLIRFVSFSGAVSNIAGQAGAYDLADGVGNSARFANPLGLSADTNGNIYIADGGNNRIRKLAPDNTVTTIISGLLEPAGVAAGDNGDLWVADTRRHAIKRYNSSGVLIYTAGLPGTSGTNDSDFASNARFTSPRGLLWMGGNTGLLIADSGSHTIRRLYFNSALGDFSVETLAGTPGQSGFVNDVPLQSRLNSPGGLSSDPVNGGFLFVDTANNAVRRLRTSAPQPPVNAPSIGVVTFPPPDFLSVLSPTIASVFNNDVKIAVLSEIGTETFFTFGPTPSSTFEDTIPIPSALNGNTPPAYRDGLTSDQVAATVPTLITPQPDVTIKLIGTQTGRQSSAVVQARFQFKVGNPSIQGANAASFVLNNVTTGAEMYYTIDGSDPTNNPSATIFGPKSPGDEISLIITNDVVFKVRAFREGFKPSEISIKEFSPTNFVANRISFGFANGEASSDFVASAGQKFYAPVTLSILPDQTMYSLQFNITVTNQNAPGVSPGAVGFQSMLKEFDPETKAYRTIPPAMLSGFSQVMITNIVGGVTNVSVTNLLEFQDLLITNTLGSDNLLGIGWLARSGLDAEVPNLFRVDLQDLITFSIAKDTLFEKANSKIVLGAYSFDVPLTASAGNQYKIEIGRPSATTDGFGAPGSSIFIQTPTNASSTIHSVKTVTVGQRKYIVGDVYPFKWLNAGDFGDTNLVSADVAQVFQTVVYGLNEPISGSDMEDAMDSCCETGTDAGGFLQQDAPGDASSVYDGNDTAINTFAFGDGNLDVRDVFVTFRRSLDPSLTWYERFYTNGIRAANARGNVFNGALAASKKASKSSVSTTPPLAIFTLGDVTGAPGATVSVPIHAQIFGDYPLRVLQFNVSIEAVDGAPAITNAIQFLPAGLGQPSLTMSSGPNNYSAAWLNNNVAGLTGTSVIGTLQIKIPATANETSAYRVHFDHISASPNGLARFKQTTQNGLVLLTNRSGSSWGDEIPDTWRIRHFGSLGNVLSQASADADGDGASNLHEYKSGTRPNDVSSLLRLKQTGGLTLRWPSVAGINYVIESSPALFGQEWDEVSTNIAGTGEDLEYTDSTPNTGVRFYRIRVVNQ